MKRATSSQKDMILKSQKPSCWRCTMRWWQWTRPTRFTTLHRDRAVFRSTWRSWVKRLQVLALQLHWKTTILSSHSTERQERSFGEVSVSSRWPTSWPEISMISEKASKCRFTMEAKIFTSSLFLHLSARKFRKHQALAISTELKVTTESQSPTLAKDLLRKVISIQL